MTSQKNDHQSTHEVGRIYDAIIDRRVLIDFFLESTLKFLSAAQGHLFLTGSNKQMWLEASTSSGEIPQKISERAEAVFKEGKPSLEGELIFFPLIARNSSIGATCFEKTSTQESFTQENLEIGFDLVSEFSGALKNILLFEENLKMERLAAIGQTMSMVIHEIKNILQLARLSDELLRLGLKEDNEKFVEHGLGKMTKALKNMDGFIWEMLSLTKDYQLEPEKVDMKKLLDELVSDLVEKAKANHIALDFKTEPNFPNVEGDGRAIYRALLNLVKNAFEACDKKDSWIKIRVQGAGEDTYQIVIEDNGSGMTKEVQAKLFQAFFSTKGKHGTGLGLMVMDRTIKMHEGKIQVESSPGNGTKFILTLPRFFKRSGK